MRKLFYGIFGGLFLLSLLLIIYKGIPARNMAGYLQLHSLEEAELAAKRRQVYDVNFIMNKAPVGKLNIYLPVFAPVDMEAAQHFAHLFGIDSGMVEGEESYIFENRQGKLEVYKLWPKIHYQLKENEEEPVEMENGDQVAALAVNYLQDLGVFVYYDEVEVVMEGQLNTVNFTILLGNLPNYAFRTSVVVSSEGKVQSLDYYYMDYEILSHCPIISMAKAYQSLPVDFPEGTVIDLKGCRLVYYYANSIIQPGYMFYGEVAGGQKFESIVGAAIFQ